MSNRQEEELKNVCLLVFANKQDIRGALKAVAVCNFPFIDLQLSEALDLPSIRDRKWTIIESDAKVGKGLKEGFDWLAQELNPQGNK